MIILRQRVYTTPNTTTVLSQPVVGGGRNVTSSTPMGKGGTYVSVNKPNGTSFSYNITSRNGMLVAGPGALMATPKPAMGVGVGVAQARPRISSNIGQAKPAMSPTAGSILGSIKK